MHLLSHHIPTNQSSPKHGGFVIGVNEEIVPPELLSELPFLQKALGVIQNSPISNEQKNGLKIGISVFFEEVVMRSEFSMLYRDIDGITTPIAPLHENSFADSLRDFIESHKSTTIFPETLARFLLEEMKKAHILTRLNLLLVANIEVALELGENLGDTKISPDQLDASLLRLQIQSEGKWINTNALKQFSQCCENNHLLFEEARKILTSSKEIDTEIYGKILRILQWGDTICRKRNARVAREKKTENSSKEIQTSLYGAKMVQTLVSYITNPDKKQELPANIFWEIIKASKINLEELQIQDIPFLSYKNWIFTEGDEQTEWGRELLEKMRNFYQENTKNAPEAVNGLLKAFDEKIVPGANFYMLFLDKNLEWTSNFWEDTNNMIASVRFTPHLSNDGRKSEYAGAMNIDSDYQKYGLIMMTKEAITERMEKYNTDSIYAHVRAGTSVERLWKQFGFIETGKIETITRSGGSIDTIKEIRLDRENFLKD